MQLVPSFTILSPWPWWEGDDKIMQSCTRPMQLCKTRAKLSRDFTVLSLAAQPRAQLSLAVRFFPSDEPAVYHVRSCGT